jgi:hypothetical protein
LPKELLVSARRTLPAAIARSLALTDASDWTPIVVPDCAFCATPVVAPFPQAGRRCDNDPGTDGAGQWRMLREPFRMEGIGLVFSVSRDEEYVHLRLTCGGRTLDMGARNHNYLLLTLARRRLADAADGCGDAVSGWICQDELKHDPTMASARLNVDVFRIRKQFAACAIVGAARIVERRPRTRQLRIGTGRVLIENA